MCFLTCVCEYVYFQVDWSLVTIGGPLFKDNKK